MNRLTPTPNSTTTERYDNLEKPEQKNEVDPFEDPSATESFDNAAVIPVEHHEMASVDTYFGREHRTQSQINAYARWYEAAILEPVFPGSADSLPTSVQERSSADRSEHGEKPSFEELSIEEPAAPSMWKQVGNWASRAFSKKTKDNDSS